MGRDCSCRRNLYVADSNNRVEKFTPGGNIATIAGTGTAGYYGYPGPATETEMLNPAGVAVDPVGNIYICAAYGLVSGVNEICWQCRICCSGRGAKLFVAPEKPR